MGDPVVQLQRPVLRHSLEPLKKHLEELLEGEMLEGLLGSKPTMDCPMWSSRVRPGTRTESG